MIKQQIIEQITKQIDSLFKTSPIHDFEKNFKAILEACFDKLDLVTREEFDIQQKVLLNTRAKLEELEQIIRKLEQQPNSNKP